MNSNTPQNGIEIRSIAFAKRANRLFKVLYNCQDESARILAKQFLRSATSIGANIQEGTQAESRADFIHKYSIALKEARESHYWLDLIIDANYVPTHLISALFDECNQIVSIITASIKTAKRNSPIKSRKTHANTPTTLTNPS